MPASFDLFFAQHYPILFSPSFNNSEFSTFPTFLPPCQPYAYLFRPFFSTLFHLIFTLFQQFSTLYHAISYNIARYPTMRYNRILQNIKQCHITSTWPWPMYIYFSAYRHVHIMVCIYIHSSVCISRMTRGGYIRIYIKAFIYVYICLYSFSRKGSGRYRWIAASMYQCRHLAFHAYIQQCMYEFLLCVCPVFSCAVLADLILSSHILSCPILLHPVLSYHMLPIPSTSHAILCHPILW